MAIVAPFKGLTYNFNVRQDLSDVVAPPYDVISEQEQDEYYQADPYNVIRLILNKRKAGDSDWDNPYTRAADHLERWESAGVLIKDDRPSIYLTSITYDPGEGQAPRTRWGIIAAVRIENEGSGVILPHERTFSAHKEDRLKLMRACNCQLSQVLGVYDDPENIILNAAKKTADFPPEVDFEFKDNTKHKMWILQNPRLHKLIAYTMRDKPIFIADGHHRYETTRTYRNMMRARYGRRRPNRSYEFVMMYLTNMSDEGMAILPYHRLITRVPNGFKPDAFLEKAEKWFDITEIPFSGNDNPGDCDSLRNSLYEAGKKSNSFALFHKEARNYYIFTLKSGKKEEMGDDLHDSQKKLDVLVLSRFILQGALGFSKEDLDDEEVFHYDSSMASAISKVQSGDYEMTFLLNPTKMDHVKEIASNSLVMPRKSTFFYPKILTGLVFNKIDPYETIQIP